MPAYNDPKARAFVAALEAANFQVTHYHGRFSFEGPAASVDDRAELNRAIQAVPDELAGLLQWDNLGKGFVLYGPPASLAE